MRHHRHWHPFGIGLSFTEKAKDFKFLFDAIKEASYELLDEYVYAPDILVADNAEAIANGFNMTFESPRCRANCWAHVIRNCDTHLKSVHDLSLRKAIRKDIVAVQVAFSESVFKRSVALFLAKYRALKNKEVDVFCDYFERVWANQHTNWYEGYLPGLPSTSNNIESFHRNGLKDKGELMKRLPKMRFLDAILPIVPQ